MNYRTLMTRSSAQQFICYCGKGGKGERGKGRKGERVRADGGRLLLHHLPGSWVPQPGSVPSIILAAPQSWLRPFRNGSSSPPPASWVSVVRSPPLWPVVCRCGSTEPRCAGPEPSWWTRLEQNWTSSWASWATGCFRVKGWSSAALEGECSGSQVRSKQQCVKMNLKKPSSCLK